MASKSALVVLACFLLINTMVGASVPDENPTFQNSTSPPPPPPSSPPVVKVSPPPAPPVAKVLPPPVEPVKSPPPSPPQPARPKSRLECVRPCGVRCKLHSRKNICMRACLACCERCKCVPPGQYGYKELCGKCYAGMTTRGGRLKCP